MPLLSFKMCMSLIVDRSSLELNKNVVAVVVVVVSERHELN